MVVSHEVSKFLAAMQNTNAASKLRISGYFCILDVRIFYELCIRFIIAFPQRVLKIIRSSQNLMRHFGSQPACYKVVKYSLDCRDSKLVPRTHKSFDLRRGCWLNAKTVYPP
jgi:hypothetical protein